MIYSTEKILDELIIKISEMNEVQAIGISGSKSPLPKAGEGDIDIFIYCDTIPSLEKRQSILAQLGNKIEDSKINIFENTHWGTGDFTLINNVETWLMYFTTSDTITNIEEILNGDYPDKLDNYYYPIGRCAMLRNINILYDKTDFLRALKEKLSVYPDKLAKILLEYHLEELDDLEDLERAVARKDVLFYHFALDIAIDHFLQALFALNKVHFPSRKRSIEIIRGFKIKPEHCEENLLEVIKFGGYSEGINQSFSLWISLINELKELASKI